MFGIDLRRNSTCWNIHTAMEKHWFYFIQQKFVERCAYFMWILWMFYCCLSEFQWWFISSKNYTQTWEWCDSKYLRLTVLWGNWKANWIIELFIWMERNVRHWVREDICTWIILELSVLPKLLNSPKLSYQSNCFGADNVLDRNANFVVLSKK